MRKNISGQKVGVQMVDASDGSAFTGSVTVSVTGDAGTQATGSVGSGACTHEGNGYHTYAPAQAETNYDLIAFTFTGSGAIPVTVQIYTAPATGFLAPATAGRTLVVDSSGIANANVEKCLGAAVTTAEYTLNGGTTSTIVFRTTDQAGNTVADDDQFTYSVFKCVAGTNAGKILLTTTAHIDAFTYNLLTTFAAAFDNTSQIIFIGKWASNVTHFGGTLQTARDVGASVNQTGDSYAVVTDDTFGIDEIFSTIVTGFTATLARLGGFTGSAPDTVYGFLRAIMRSDASTPVGVGGTFDPATDSLQAQRDSIDTQLDALPTAVENADALLGRNVAGGSSTGRTVAEALARLRNRCAISAGTFTVYATNDSTTLWTAALTSDDALEPVSDFNPA